MCDFETVLDHLGPSAEPLMTFLYKNDAKNLRVVNKYIGDFVLRHNKRWKFTQATFTARADGGFSISTSTRNYSSGPLTLDQNIRFGPNLPFGPKPKTTHAVYINTKFLGLKRLIGCTKNELDIIKKAAATFVKNHQLNQGL